MILNKYNKIMKNIEVTLEMRERILKNISERTAPKKQSFFVKYKAWFAAVACLALFVIGGISLAKLNADPPVDPPPVQVIPDFTECADISELSEKIGFEVVEPKNLPFDFDNVSYTMLWGEVAEIMWQNGGELAGYFRMALGNDDISGDHADYSDIASIDINGNAVTLKGDGTAYSAAVWTDDMYFYSLNLTVAVSQEQLAAIVKTVIT